MIIELIISFLPVIIFLICLFLLDSFKLARKDILLLSLGWGLLSALISYYTNTLITNKFSLDFVIFSRYVAPIIEETTKALCIIVLISRKRIGFAVDAAVYGFSVGTGFALAENLYYMIEIPDSQSIVLWVVRGFGTAMMHGGCTALFSIILMAGIQREKHLILSMLPGIVTSILLHSAFNHFFVNPYLQTGLIFVLLPVVFIMVFEKSNTLLQGWLEIEFSQEVELLRNIKQGKFSDTKAGNYLISLKKHFTPEMIVDLYCYISLYMELSVKAKRNLMLKENDFPIPEEDDIAEKLSELEQLRKQIGKMGEMALQPIIRMKYRDLWKLNQLRN